MHQRTVLALTIVAAFVVAGILFSTLVSRRSSAPEIAEVADMTDETVVSPSSSESPLPSDEPTEIAAAPSPTPLVAGVMSASSPSPAVLAATDVSPTAATGPSGFLALIFAGMLVGVLGLVGSAVLLLRES